MVSGVATTGASNMITLRTIADPIAAEPFRPFRLHMASGRTFFVDHPEIIKVGRSSVTVFARPEPNTEEVDRWQEVSLMRLESVESLLTITEAGSTGL